MISIEIKYNLGNQLVKNNKEKTELEREIKIINNEINETLNKTLYNFVNSSKSTTSVDEIYQDQLKLVELLYKINNSTVENKYKEKFIMFANYENGNKDK